MQELSTSDASTSRVRLQVLGLAGLLIGAAAGVTFFWVGDLTATRPSDADYLRRPWPFLTEHETVIGVVSVIVFVVAGAMLVAKWRKGQMPLFLVAQFVVLALFAAWLGFGYRVVTAGVVGANIGGGGVVLLTPVLAVVAIVLVVGLGIWGSRRTKRTT